jgi:cytochrome c556
MKPLRTGFLTISLLLFVSGLLWAGNIIKTDMSGPKDIVEARKTLMMAIKFNMDDVNTKRTDKNLEGIQANAMAIDAMARVIPPLFKERHKDVYTGPGNYYKGAPPSKIEAISKDLSSSAQTLLSGAANQDEKVIKDAITDVYKTCMTCHKKYRGMF